LLRHALGRDGGIGLTVLDKARRDVGDGGEVGFRGLGNGGRLDRFRCLVIGIRRLGENGRFREGGKTEIARRQRSDPVEGRLRNGEIDLPRREAGCPGCARLRDHRSACPDQGTSQESRPQAHLHSPRSPVRFPRGSALCPTWHFSIMQGVSDQATKA